MRRGLRAYAGAAAFAGLLAVAGGPAVAKPMDLRWQDLIPVADQAHEGVITGVVQHEQIASLQATVGPATPKIIGPAGIDWTQPPSQIRADLDGKDVKMGGYVVPLAFEGIRLTEFLLVPFVGACVHVPPPPANQIVFVRSRKGIDMNDLTQAVSVSGTLSAKSVATDMAEVGYQLQADDITPLPE